VRDLDEHLGVAGEGEQQLKLVRAVKRAVGHVIDDDDEARVSFDQRREVG
jgi:hypothetical protein